MMKTIGGVLSSLALAVGGAVVGLLWHTIDPNIGYEILSVCGNIFIGGVLMMFGKKKRKAPEPSNTVAILVAEGAHHTKISDIELVGGGLETHGHSSEFSRMKIDARPATINSIGPNPGHTRLIMSPKEDPKK